MRAPTKPLASAARPRAAQFLKDFPASNRPALKYHSVPERISNCFRETYCGASGRNRCLHAVFRNPKTKLVIFQARLDVWHNKIKQIGSCIKERAQMFAPLDSIPAWDTNTSSDSIDHITLLQIMAGILCIQPRSGKSRELESGAARLGVGETIELDLCIVP